MSEDLPACAVCLRPILPDDPQSLHHLIPKLKGGRGGPTVLVHDMCHREIHAAATEAELARLYDTPEKLRAHPQLAKFAAWLARKPAGFRVRTLKSERRRRKR